ncbi:molybdate transport system ATP-binding protein [Massilia aurea]|uniref:Molybdate transport system ATP-binding protein n=1 Tax=Massilia aurea TaxID=373040 RepID=A0A7X0CF70_9BURK|nr:molybdenum ABC transporter ATP-binding protein [Massilia aurea]MBB6134654.1 molybdate transport system ATP-binding protein [Massilia aurea]
MTPISLACRIDRGTFKLDVDLALPGRGVTALFGHSGSGKTTLLRVLAGLERVAGARVALGDEVWQDDARKVFVPTHERGIGYVFQEASLFPHLSVRANLEFGRKRLKPAERRFDLLAVAELLGIERLLDASPSTLSGGERQRAAIARTLLASPRLLLMDEPLAALDMRRKLEILPYLERLHDELALPVVYVSHAADEVARLADHLVVLEEGRVLASGPLAATLARLDLAANFQDDAGVMLETTLQAHDADGLSHLAFAGGVLLVGQRDVSIGTRVRCRIHARDVSLALERPRGSSITNILPARVDAVGPSSAPGQVLVRLLVGETALLARITERSRRELAIAQGCAVWAQVKAVALLA